ncbi:hypothetical protein [Rhizobium sp. Leaf386]|uniref:hypothetical protein n=1 Tax=Rhizobium sp. Leaf386 TaxID=1736359 RepID=UPI000713E70B|nr:hypothetical protein [Rhizobium sp. Leaf386]KQS95343.1 hypothetical protein ASG50_25285 [Rhizobium sp. Leaf386]
MNQTPLTPSEWLAFAAELASKHPFKMITPAGEFLQSAMTMFLVEAGSAGADPTDLQADLLTLLPRIANALLVAEHKEGRPCVMCAMRFASLASREIITDMQQMADRRDTGGLH